MDKLVDFLCAKEGKLIKNQRIVDKDGTPTSMFNITIRFPHNHAVNLEALTGRQTVDKELIFITRYGEQIRCTFCNEYGHVKKDCATHKMECNKCGKRGHLSSSCNMAKKTADDIQDIEELEETGTG
jgi:Zinc knuckle